MTPKERIERHKARVKKHFLAKRLAKAKASNSNTASAPKHKATPSTTAGKAVSYFNDKSRVVDLGHEPSKSTISAAAAKLRKARAATTPKARPNTAAKAPEIKLTTAAEATTPNPQATNKSNVGFVVGGSALAAAGAATIALKKRKINHSGRGELKLTGIKAEVAASKAVKDRGPAIKAAKEAVVREQRARRASTASTAAHKPVSGRPPTPKEALAQQSTARRAKQGAELRNAFGAAERADARAAAKPTTTVINLGKSPSPIKIAEARAKGHATPATQETSMTEAAQDARAKGAINKAQKGLTDPATAVQKSESRAGDRRQGETTRRGPDRQTKRGAASESRARDIGNQRSNRRKKGSEPQGAKSFKVPTAGESETQRIARINTERNAAAHKAPAAPKAAAVSLTGTQRQSINQAARAAMRSGDAVAMRKALAGLPETGKKAIKYRKNLEAGIQSAGNKPAAPDSPNVDLKLKAELQAERAKNVKLKGKAAPATKAPAKPKSSYKQRDKNFRDQQNRIDPKTGKPMQLPQEGRTPAEIEAHQTRNLMETTIDEKRITPEREAAEARERAVKRGGEARTELVVREAQEATPKQGKAPTPTGRAPANRGVGEAVAKAAVTSPEAPRVTEAEAAHQKLQRYNAEGRQTENVNVEEVARQVKENAKLGEADNMRQKMARAAADAVLKDVGKQTSAAKPKAISLTSQSSTPPPKVSKQEAYRNYEALKETGVKSPTAGKPKAKAPATPKVELKPGLGTSPRVGEQLPRTSPKTKVIPSKADMLAEQARGDTSPPKTPPKSRPPMNKPSSFTFADSIRKYAMRYATPLTGPAIDAAGSKAKATSKAAARVAKGGAVAATAFTVLSSSEAGAKELGKGVVPAIKATAGEFKDQFLPTVKSITEFAAKDLTVSKILPALARRGAAKLGAGAVAAATVGAGVRLAGRGLLALEIGSEALPYTGAKLGELAYEANETKKAFNAAAKEKKGSEAKYGTIERATKTRHAKEAYKKKQRDLLTGGK